MMNTEQKFMEDFDNNIDILQGSNLLEIEELVEDEVNRRLREVVGSDGLRMKKVEDVVEGYTQSYGPLTVYLNKEGNELVAMHNGEIFETVSLDGKGGSRLTVRQNVMKELDRLVIKVPDAESVN